jgi:hypothetical protein
VIPEQQPTWFRSLHRALAAAGVVLVFALGLFAASPELHGKLHASDQVADDGCAVVLFAGGVVLLTVASALPPRLVAWPETARVAFATPFVDSPRYLLQPERGPPAA